MSVVPTLQIPIRSQAMTNLAQTRAAGVHIAIAALVQNQVDHILRLRNPHLVRFHDWKHEDHRNHRAKSRNTRKKSLLQQYPGLLSGPQAEDLHGDDWTPRYIISASIPASNLQGPNLGTDLEICNVIWQHKTPKKPLALTLYINHADPTSSSQHTPASSRLLVGQKGLRLAHASQYLMEALRKEPVLAPSNDSGTQQTGMGLRVGHTVGEFYWQAGPEAGHPDRLVLKEEDLTPYSLANLELRPEFTFPYDTDANRILGAEKKTRVRAIYWRRFQFKMSERGDCEAAMAVTEPHQERAFVKADEEVITIRGLNNTLTPEYLFSDTYTIFPPQREWPISFPSCASPVFSFFMPELEDSTSAPPMGRFYSEDRLIATSPAGLHRVGINYFGTLDISGSGFDVQVTGKAVEQFQQHLCRAVDKGIRDLPELAVELAIDILTEPSALPDDCGSMPSFAGDDAARAYRTAFETAWLRLDPELANHQSGVYPYVQSLATAQEDKALIQDLGMHPIPVHPRVRLLLAKSGAYPQVKDYAESLLLSRPGAPHLPAGVDILKAALPKLLPDADLATDPLSVRQYAHSYPRLVWDPVTRTFVMASSFVAHRCNVHRDAREDLCSQASEAQASQKQHTSQCLCWIGLALQAAASSWRSKNGEPGSRSGFDEEFFHVLLDCYQTAFPALLTIGLASLPEDGGEEESRTNPEEQDGDAVSYASDTAVQAADTTSQVTAVFPGPSSKAAVATSFSPSAGNRGSIVPYPSPMSSPPLPRRQMVMKARTALQQSSPQLSISTARLGGAQNPVEHRGYEDAPEDKAMKEIFGIWEEGIKSIAHTVQASKSFMLERKRESAALQEELAEEQTHHATLDRTFAAYKIESEAALAAKHTMLAANAEAMKQKDAQIGQLKESVHALTARVQEQAAVVEKQAALSQDQKNTSRSSRKGRFGGQDT